VPEQFRPAFTDQPGTDVAVLLGINATSPLFRQSYGAFGDLLLGFSARNGQIFYRPPAPVTGCKIHIGVDPGRVPAQDLLHPTELLENLPPVQQGQLAQAGEGIAAGELLPGLSIQFTLIEFVQGVFEGALKPVFDGGQGGLFIVEQADQLHTEKGAGIFFRSGKFCQNREQLAGIAAVGGNQPVGPEIGQLAFTQVIQGSHGQVLDAFNQCDAQHLGDGPQFTDGQGTHRLMGFDKCQDVFTIEAQFGVRDKVLGQCIDAGHPLAGLGGQHR